MTFTQAPPTPFGDHWLRIKLDDAPLAHVFAQIRFNYLLRVGDQKVVSRFQDRIRADYPVLNREVQQQIRLTGDGLSADDQTTIWRFRDTNGLWQVSLTSNFVALDTTAYDDRHDFYGRLERIVGAVEDTIRPDLATRVGIRYVDRITDDDISSIKSLVRGDLLTVEALDLGKAEVQRTMTEAAFTTNVGELRGRWGMVPGSTTHDPSIAPVGAASWVLDLDAFSEGDRKFATQELIATTKGLGEVVYRFFRWAVSDEFLDRFRDAK